MRSIILFLVLFTTTYLSSNVISGHVVPVRKFRSAIDEDDVVPYKSEYHESNSTGILFICTLLIINFILRNVINFRFFLLFSILSICEINIK